MIVLRGEKRILKQRSTAFYVAPTMNGGVSLGNYIFLSERSGLKEPAYDNNVYYLVITGSVNRSELFNFYDGGVYIF